MAPRPIDVTLRGKNELKPGFDSAEGSIKSFGERAKGLLVSPFAAVGGAVAGIAVTMAASFAKASVESAAAADAAWGRVESSVTNAGISFKGVKGQLDALFTSIQKTTRYSDDDAASAFSTLLTISNDYAGSVKNLGLAADIAAKKQIGIGDAAELVGKVMAGETGMLKRYGIVLSGTGDAMDQLRAKFNGFSERDGKTLEGRLEQIANAWDNVKEAVGRALSGDGGSKGMDAFATTLNNFGKWIDTHSAEVSKLANEVERLAAGLVRLGVGAAKLVAGDYKGAGQDLVGSMGKPWFMSQETYDYNEAKRAAAAHKLEPVKPISAEDQAKIDENGRKARAAAAAVAQKAADEAEKKHIDDLKNEYDVLEKIGKQGLLNDEQQLKMATLEQQMRVKAGVPLAVGVLLGTPDSNPANRAAAADFVARIEAERKQQAEQVDKASRELANKGIIGDALRAEGVHTIGDMTTTARAAAAALPVTAGSTSSHFGRGAAESFAESFGGGDALNHVDQSLGTLEEHMQSFTGGALGNFFTTWQEGIGDIITGHEALGTAILKSARKAIGGAMAAEGQATLLKAAAAAAEGFLNPTAFLSAGKLLAVGSLELAFAASLSGGGSGGGSYGGGVSSSGLSAAQADASSRGKTTIILQGNGLNFTNPDDLDALTAALRELGNTGDIEVIVRGGATR